jgi:hypothetical protein
MAACFGSGGNTASGFPQGSGGGLRYRNNIAVVPGQQLTVTVGKGGRPDNTNGGGGRGGQGAVRVIWGDGRSFPFNAGSTY